MTDKDEPLEMKSTEVTEVLSSILASDDFASSPILQKMLSYVVSEELAGRGDKIKAFSIGLDALGKPNSFDPQSDPIVRVNFGRLRSALFHYYNQDGQNDPIKIEIPKGGYRPKFLTQNTTPPVLSKNENSAPASLSSVETNGSSLLSRYPAALLVVAGIMGLLIVGAGGIFLTPWFAQPNRLPEQQTENTQNLQVNPTVITIAISMPDETSLPQEQKQMTLDALQELRVALSRNKAFAIIYPYSRIESNDDGKSTDNQTNNGVDFVVSGVVRGTIPNRKFIVEVINNRTKTLVWARSYNFGSQKSDQNMDVVTQQTTRELNTQLMGASKQVLEGRDVTTLSASQLFVMATWVPGLARNTLVWEQERVRLARLALEKDPEFGPAYSVLADKLSYLANMDPPTDAKGAGEQARAYAQRAAELAPNDANTLFNVAQSHWHSGRLREAGRTMQRVIDLNPDHALARSLLQVMPYTCTAAPYDVVQSAIDFDRSLDEDNPIRWVTLTWIGWLHLNRDEYEQALNAEERASQVFKTPYSFMRHAAILNMLGQTEKATQLLLAQKENWPNLTPEHYSTVTMPRLCHENLGNDTATRYYDRLTEATSSHFAK